MPPTNNSTAPQQGKINYVSTTQALEELCARLANVSVLAIDTEFVRDRTYYPRLCLIQIAADDVVACIDPLKIDDLSPLKTLLFDNNIIKVFHAARQDLEILYYVYGAIPSPVFDTQIAATLLGLGEQIGYANLVKHYMKIDIPKGQARADWEQRPLAAAQLEYAANDVRYLLQIYPYMLNKLSSLGRVNWLDEDFADITNEKLYQSQPEQIWQRVSGIQKLRGIQLAVLQSLTAWRETRAQQLDKPRKWILPDDMLITLSMQMPDRIAQLSRIRGLNTGVIERSGEDIITQIRLAREQPESEWPRLARRHRLDKQQEAVLDAVMAVIKLQAAQHDINTGAITSKSELEKLVSGERDIPLLHGWRLSVAGQQALDFLNGQTSLQYKNKELLLTQPD